MSAKKNPADLNPDTFDLDAWIDDVIRPETTVSLYANDREYAAEVARIEALIPDAERVKPEDRGLDDPTPESLAAQIATLREQREAKALKVRIRQVLRHEQKAIISESEDGLGWFSIVAEATVEPKFTVEQLLRLYNRDASGESMVDQLTKAVMDLNGGLPTPS